MASWMSASVVIIPLWFCEAVFYPFVKAILLDLLLRVNNLQPRCCHCADVFLDVMSCRRERLSAVISQDATEIWPNLFSVSNSFRLKLNTPSCIGGKSALHQTEQNREGRLHHNLICPNLLHSALTLYITAHIREQQAGAYSKFSNQCECETCLLFSGPDGGKKKNPYSWHNIISMSLLENNSICKDGGGIHYQQLGWNDNTHYTAISLHKAANGSNHSTLINKTLSFVSTWRASSIFHWDSHSWARQHGPNILTAGGTTSIAPSCVGTDRQLCRSQNKRLAEWKSNQWDYSLCGAAQNDHHISAGADRIADRYRWINDYFARCFQNATPKRTPPPTLTPPAGIFNSSTAGNAAGR